MYDPDGSLYGLREDDGGRPQSRSGGGDVLSRPAAMAAVRQPVRSRTIRPFARRRSEGWFPDYRTPERPSAFHSGARRSCRLLQRNHPDESFQHIVGKQSACRQHRRRGREHPPKIGAFTVQGTRQNEPPNFADASEQVPVSLEVTDAESAISALKFNWSASVGTFIGSGRDVTWKAPSSVPVPSTVTPKLEVVETFASQGRNAENRVTGSTTVSLHDSHKRSGGNGSPVPSGFLRFHHEGHADRHEKFRAYLPGDNR